MVVALLQVWLEVALPSLSFNDLDLCFGYTYSRKAIFNSHFGWFFDLEVTNVNESLDAYNKLKIHL